MEWRPAYSVGIEEIDNQHKELLRRFAKVEELVNANAKWPEVHFAMVEVRQFAEFHFRFEEALLRLYGYGAAPTHTTEHRTIADKLLTIERAAVTEDSGNIVVRFFRDWLVGHIEKSDRDYANFILAGAPVARSVPAT